MDGSRFDDLTRELARGGLTRRRLLKCAIGGLVAGAAGAAGAGLPGADTAEAACKALGRTCLVGGQCCSGTCVLVGLPPLRLLQCACPRGTENCQGTCKGADDYQSDPQHCGACGQACAEGEVCAAGVCVCPPGMRRCDGGCTPIDEQNCSACGLSCPAGGVCTLDGTTGRCSCPPDTTLCNRACVSTVCPPGQVFDLRRCGCCAGALDGQPCPSSCSVPTNPHGAEPCPECCSGLCSGSGVCCASSGRSCPSGCAPNGVIGDCPGCCFPMCGVDGFCG